MASDTSNHNKPPFAGLPASGSNASAGNLTPGAITDAVVALMRAANPGAEPDTALAARVAGGIQPMLVSELAKGRATTGQELLTGPGFANVVTQYLGSPNSGYLDDVNRKALLAQLQRANVSSSDSVALSAALGGLVPLQASQRSGSSFSAGSTDSGKRFDALSLASIQTEVEYRSAPATAELVGAGVSFQTFQTLRADGFSPGQMVSAVRFTKSIGLEPNQSAVHVAHIQRARPEDANSAMRDTSANWKSVAGLEKALVDAKAQGAPQEKIDGIQKQLREMHEYSRDYDKGYQGKVETSKPSEGHHYEEFSRQVQEMVNKGATPVTATSQIEGELRRNRKLDSTERKARQAGVDRQGGLSNEEKIKKMKSVVAEAPTRPAAEQPAGQSTLKTAKLDLG
ncbi:MAG TPA: hypothetical protein VHY35_18430 [Stellaceae bacterium]|jgi:hypothetical protein|nr:hypothetical protein [Stellaceae bacterium]